MSVAFEGSEKKLEVVVREGYKSLREWPRERWEAIVAASRAQILSHISSSDCDAYLLSESSLFVWNNRFCMITCGTTTLVEAAQKTFEFLSVDDVECLIYERKNEYFPQMQKSDFYDDVKLINNMIPGQAFRLGNADEHHLFMFHSKGHYKPDANDRTLEILMYDLQGVAKDVFNTPGLKKERIRELTKVHEILDGFKVDDFAFEPIGYSLNALKDNYYFTIHVTPQDISPYVSFETNMVDGGQAQKVLSAVIEAFRPRSFDVVFFETHNVKEIFDMASYERRSQVQHTFACGYTVQYGHFSQNQIACHSAFELEIR